MLRSIPLAEYLQISWCDRSIAILTAMRLVDKRVESNSRNRRATRPETRFYRMNSSILEQYNARSIPLLLPSVGCKLRTRYRLERRGGGGGSINHDFPLIQTNGCAPIDKNLSEWFVPIREYLIRGRLPLSRHGLIQIYGPLSRSFGRQRR